MAKPLFLTKRDFEILKFIWRWKIASTSVIHLHFCKDLSPLRAFNILNALKTKKMLTKIHLNESSTWVWTLTKGGFLKIKESLGPLSKAGYKSESPEHDYLVSLVQLGHWVSEVPEGYTLTTEQELRCYEGHRFGFDADFLQKRRPDGFWTLPIDDKKVLLALEVELHQKSKKQYERITESYNRNGQIGRVFWFLNTKRQAESLLKIADNQYPQKDKHNFVLISDFKKSIWNAKICLGPNAGRTMGGFLADPRRETADESTPFITSVSLFDKRTVPVKTNT